MDEKELIVVKTLPVIEEQLRSVKEQVDSIAEEAKSLAVTEDNLKYAKGKLSELRKIKTEFENRRKEVKKEILAPYEKFEAVYKENVSDSLDNAISILNTAVKELEDGRKRQKQEEVEVFFDEYRDSLNLSSDLVSFSRSEIKVGLSDTVKSLKTKAKEFLDRINGDLQIINLQENSDEIYVEYHKDLNLSRAMLTVRERKEMLERAEKRRQEAEAARLAKEKAASEVREALEKQKAEEELQIPVSMPDPDMPVIEPEKEPLINAKYLGYMLRGTKVQLRALKEALTEYMIQYCRDGGIEYVSIDE